MNSTARVALPILVSFALSVILYPIFIPYLRRLKAGQTVRGDGPQSHLKKTGTPTMGGLAIVFALIVSTLLFTGRDFGTLAILAVTAAFAVIGFSDDYIKVVKRRADGLSAAQKFTAQFIAAGAYLFAVSYNGADLSVVIPFTGASAHLGVWAIPFLLFVMLGTVNGANFTDGLDGLAAGVTALIAVFFLIVSIALGSPLTPMLGSAVGALLGFLLFNSYPARVFMGDTGSLALGAFVAAVAIHLNMALFIVIVAFVYLAEVLSVILQVSYFKASHGKRIFKMAPIHHHFEKMGWAETKVVAVFYIVTAMLCLIGILAANGLFDKII